MKLFGKDLFSFKKKEEFMYDFAQHGLLRSDSDWGLVEIPPEMEKKGRGRPKKKLIITPKGLYALGALNKNDFHINTDKNYLDEQLVIIQHKLDFLGKKPKTKKDKLGYSFDGEQRAVSWGRTELESIKRRLLNRYQIKEYQSMLEQYPHTTSQLIGKIVDEHNHLACGVVGSFVPDLPTDAIQAMNEYNDMCMALCGQKTNFYVLAKKEDFEKVNKRRDPILFAQSPFGHFWQILGAWDEEMVFLGDL